MKFTLGLLGAGLLVAGCASEPTVDDVTSDLGSSPELNNLPRHFPTNNAHSQAGGGGGGGNLVNHGGPTITNAHVVPIFWGPSWQAGDATSRARSSAT